MNLKFWERQKVETRESAYTNALIQVITDMVNQEPQENATAIKEACAGLWSRAFASAEVAPDNAATRALDAGTLAMIGRNLYECGESVFEIAVMNGAVKLLPAAAWFVEGGNRWRYKLDIAQPSSVSTRYRPAESVVHLRYDTDSARPWQAHGPINRASTTATMIGNLETRMGQEANMPMGNLIPVPHVDDKLQGDLHGLKGKAVLVPSTAEGWDVGTAAQQRPDWKIVRLGADYPESLERTRQGVGDHVMAAGGVPPSLFRSDGEGTAKREAWRQFLHGTIQPVAKILAVELREKLEVPDLTLSFKSLFASDLSGRARAFQSMVGGGMEIAAAAALAGLLIEDD